MDSVEQRYGEERARMHRLMAAESLRSELPNTLTEAQMQKSYNALMEARTRPINGDVQRRYLACAQIYAEELMRRETVRLKERMQRLMVTLAVLVILATTIMSVILSTLTLRLGGWKEAGRFVHLAGLVLENEAARFRSGMVGKGTIVGSSGALRSRIP